LTLEDVENPIRDEVSVELWREEEKKIIIDLLRALKVKITDETMEDTGMLEAYDRILGGKEREFMRKVNLKLEESRISKENKELSADVTPKTQLENASMDDIVNERLNEMPEMSVSGSSNGSATGDSTPADEIEGEIKSDIKNNKKNKKSKGKHF